MPETFPVPDAYRDHDPAPERRAWVDALPGTAERLAEKWGLVADGEPRFGFLGIVWPVRDAAGRPLVLKVHSSHLGTDGEGVALDVARGPALVELVRADPTNNALLLERLDPTRTLEDVDIEAACGIIGDLVAQISSHDAPPGMRAMADELDRTRDSILGRLAFAGDAVPRSLVDHALDTLAGLAADLRGSGGPLPLVHGDCHYVNVLHTLPGEPSRWVAIDPLPVAGYPELEVIPAVRNRWSDAAATGDAEAALRRRCDIICERAELDRDRARLLLQAVAVDNVLWLSRATDVSPLVRSFLPPFSIVARWT